MPPRCRFAMRSGWTQLPENRGPRLPDASATISGICGRSEKRPLLFPYCRQEVLAWLRAREASADMLLFTSERPK
jgi:hypothetical protein